MTETQQPSGQEIVNAMHRENNGKIDWKAVRQAMGGDLALGWRTERAKKVQHLEEDVKTALNLQDLHQQVDKNKQKESSPNARGRLRVHWNTLPYRSSGASFRGTIDGNFEKGDELDVLEQEGKWYKVQKGGGGAVWIWGGGYKSEKYRHLGNSVRAIEGDNTQGESAPVPDEGKASTDQNVEAHDTQITPQNIAQISETAEGRARIRELSMDENGVFTLTNADPRYRHLAIHRLYRPEDNDRNTSIFVVRNGETIEGKWSENTYVPIDKSSPRVYVRTNDKILLERPEEMNVSSAEIASGDIPGLSILDMQILSTYENPYDHVSSGAEDIFNRTFEGRLNDHIHFIDAVMSPDSNSSTTNGIIAGQKSEVEELHSVLFPTPNQRSVFIDIGPGIANADFVLKGGNGKPAISSQEMAEAFPNMEVVALDLPNQVEIFTGERKGTIRGSNQTYTVDPAKREAFLVNDNIHILSGDGLISLADQLQDPSTNPYPARERPSIDANTTVFIRAANSIDIYCDWDQENGGSPSVKDAIARMGEDFKQNPVVLFFNKEILMKPANSKKWSIIGKTSNRGFRHNDRILPEPHFTLGNSRISS